MGRHFSKVRGPRAYWAPQTKKSGGPRPPGPPVATPMIKLRAPAVAAKIGVLYVTLGLLARGGHSSNKYCVMDYGSI